MKKLWMPLLSSLFVIITVCQAESMELRFASAYPPNSAPAQLEEEYVAKVEEVTGGKVQITIFPSSTLLGEKDILVGVSAGITDIGELVITMHADRFPLNNIICFPFMPLVDTKTCASVWEKLEDKFPEMKAETNDFKVLYPRIFGNLALHTTKKPVRLPEDVKGLKLQMAGPMIQAIKSLGGSPSAFEVMDWYNCLDRGIMDGVWVVMNGPVELQFYKLTPYHTIFPSGTSFYIAFVIMNPKTWEKIPKDAQNKIDELKPWLIDRMATLNDEPASKARALMEQEEGQIFITLTPEEEQKWVDSISLFRDEYFSRLDAKGLPATAVYQEILNLTK